jgi:hypothetical protein
MTHYHKERDAFIEHQNRCTRNMPPQATSRLPDPLVDAFTVTWPTEERINNIGQNGPTGAHYMNKYQRKLTNPIIREMDGGLIDIEVEVVIDVYHVLDAYPSGCPPIDHAIKKLLCTGSRGAKDWETDLQEAIDSLERAKSFPPLPF